jgi:hypothetical protein
METKPPRGPGRVSITPPRDVKEQALARGQPLLVAQARVCVGPDGMVQRAVIIDSSGIDCFDEHVTAALLRSTLRFLIRAKNGCGTMTVQWNANSVP